MKLALKRGSTGGSGWLWLAGVVAGLVMIPVLFVASSLFSDSRQVWQHLASTVLARYLLNSLGLMVGVGIGVLLIGVSTAWLVSLCRFPGQRLLAWALLLPLATPAYVLAYVYTDFLDFAGPVQTGLRQIMGWQARDYGFPNIRSLGGAIVLFVLVLYPYVYLAARLAFLEQSRAIVEVSRSLGCDPWRSFWQVALPLARPLIVGGLSLAWMETLNDFGTVQYFGVDTFTTGIYRTWFGLGERTAAAQLAAFLLMFIGLLLGLERAARRQRRYHQSSSDPIPPYSLHGWRALAAGSVCVLPIGLGFGLPTGLLLHLTLTQPEQTFNAQFRDYALHSLILALVTAGLAVIVAVILAYGQRIRPIWGLQVATRIAAMGYAIPGSVIAVGILVPLGQLDNAIDAWMRQTWGISTGLLLSGTLVALIFAYLVRFLAVSFSPVEASLSKIKPHLDEAARSLGHGSGETLLRIHLPLLWKGLLTAGLLVFVDVMKELPATLVIRPFNFDTLAVRTYQLASDERLAEAAGPALAIVLVGLLPVILLSKRIGSG